MNKNIEKKENKIKKFFKKSFEKAFIGIAALTISCGGVETEDTQNTSKNYKSPPYWDMKVEESLDDSLRTNYNEKQLQFIDWLNKQCKNETKFSDAFDTDTFGNEKVKFLYSTTLQLIQYDDVKDTTYYELVSKFRIENAFEPSAAMKIENYGENTENDRITMRFTALFNTGYEKIYYYGRRTGTGLPKGFGWNLFKPSKINSSHIPITFEDPVFEYSSEEHDHLSYVYICKTMIDTNTKKMFQEILIVPPTEIQETIKNIGVTKEDIEEMENLVL